MQSLSTFEANVREWHFVQHSPFTCAGRPIGYIETKDIGDRDLEGYQLKGDNKEQFDRYKSSLQNIIFTDYLRFLYYRDGEL